MTLRNYSTVGAVILALEAANMLVLHNPALGFVVFLDALLGGFVLGNVTLSRLSLGWKLVFGSLAYGASRIVLGTLLYYLVGFGTTSILVVAAVPFFVVCALWSRSPKPITITPDWIRFRKQISRTDAFRSLCIITVDLAALVVVSSVRTDAALRSPWEVVPWQFFILFGIASIGIFTLFTRDRGRGLLLPLAILHTFVGLSIALNVYVNGFGFDPFIHQRSAIEVAEHGVVLPKTPYYIGQYVQVTAASRLTAFPLEFFNRSVTPIIASILPPIMLFALGGLAPLSLLFPLPMFILTTPQGTGYVLLLATATAAALGTIPAWMIWIFALAAASFHPIAGIPALAIAAFLTLRRLQTTDYSLQRLGTSLLFIGTVVALPIAFWLNARSGGALDVEIILPTLGEIVRAIPIPSLTIPNHFDLPLDLAYLLRWNIPLIVAALAIFGAWRTADRKRLAPHLLTGIAMIASYVIVRSAFRFPGVIAYEESIFPSRLVETSAIVLVPVMAMGMTKLLDRTHKNSLRIGAVLLFAAMTTASVYLSYPRVDRYEKNSGRSLSSSMIRAVDFIEDRAEKPYVVLADQNAAAAQISRYGFGEYYKGSYFYSHPSGGLDLYRFYQQMVEDGPSRETALAAMDFAGVDTVYFVVHDYWKNFPDIVAAAQESADEGTEIDDGTVYVFRYIRASAESLEM